jgi:hypothetical protein
MTLGIHTTVHAQGSRFSGYVCHVTLTDSLAVSGRTVLLHEVRGPTGFISDSTTTDRNGRYQFSVPAPDTAARYFVSVEHHDIGYFSSPLPAAPGSADTFPAIVVYDTSYSRPTIELRERHIIVRGEDVDGTRQIIEFLTLGNSGRFTRIAQDTSTPVWQGVLPLGAAQMAVGESDVGTGAVYGRGGRLAVAAPIPPGEKQLLFSYVVPRLGGQLQFPVDQSIARVTISLEDTTAVAVGGGLKLYGVEEVGGAVFKRYDAGNIAAGMSLSVRFEQAIFSIARLKIALIFLVAILLGGTLFWWMWKQRSVASH